MKDALQYIKHELLKNGADDVIVEEDISNEHIIKFVDNKIVNIQNGSSTSIGLFLAMKKRVVGTTIKELKKEVIDRTLKEVLKFSRLVEPNEEYYAIAQGPFKITGIKGLYDKNIADLSEQGIKIVKEAIENARDNGAKRSSGILQWSNSKRRIVTSGNVDGKYPDTSIYFSIRSFTDKISSGAQTSCSNVLKGLDYLEASRRAAEIAVLAKNPQKLNEGVYDIVFDPLPIANLLNPLMEAASAFEVKNGNSFFKDMLKKNVASKNLTMVDQGNLPNGFGSAPFDDEGMPTQKNVVIKKGVLKTYLHNTSTAHLFKTKSTGNAGVISPRAFNIVIKNGNVNDMLKEIDHGLYVTNSWYTRFQNYVTGDFSTVPRDGIFLVKNGEIVKSLKDIRISDNLPAIMKRIISLGRKRKQIYSWEVQNPVLTPQFFIEKVKVTKSSN